MRNPLPEFMVIGAQKSGTSWLAQWLASSPDVYMPPEGELMYFDNAKRHDELGIDGYRSRFSEAAPGQRIGERTASYLWVSGHRNEWGAPDTFRQGVPERVSSALGNDVRLVAVLRNPIDRAISAFLHHRRRGRITSASRLADEWTKRGLVHMGFYGSHLDRWQALYPPQNFLIMLYENLFSDDQELRRVSEFLSIEPPAAGPASSEFIHRGIGFMRDEHGAFEADGRKIADPSDIELLRQHYQPEVARLGDTWNVDVQAWQQDFPQIEMKREPGPRKSAG